ncbi:sigma-70 family RNA polymerase sigma factor [Gemmata sp.]|uniref:sigma-70 family RNA polymerase sigma factor n=1 Tax=Gemmata sp. TaxID=1914242 RepID=UPI003F6EFCC6
MTSAEAADLVDRYTPLVRSVAAGWGGRFPWLADDFLSDALLATWRATPRHDPTRLPYPAFVRVVARRACAARLLVERRRNPAALGRRAVPLDADGSPVDLAELLADPHPRPPEVLERTEEAATAAELLAALPARQRDLVLRAFAGETKTELGEGLGVSRSRVYQLVKRSVAAMRAAAAG